MPSPQTSRRSLRAELAQFRDPDAGRSAAQLALTLAIFLAGATCAVHAARRAYPVGLALALPCALLWVRLFILQHDLGHGSLFRSARLNHVLGSLLGIVTLTPFFRWRATHAAHHATSGNLDARQLDRDIFTMTVREYRTAPALRRLGYRCFRHPAVLFGLIPLFVFTLEQRFAYGRSVRWRERLSVWGTNAGLALIALGLHAAGWLGTTLAVVLPMVAVAGGAGIWLFYVQHQFPQAYWRPRAGWSFDEASIQGSSYLDLPAPLRWLTADIGVHHVHHLEPTIPYYRLAEAHRSHPLLATAPRFGLREALRFGAVDLWDEAQARMVRFGEVAARGAKVVRLPPRSR
jgi:omega-6 fatty acid desaturase (delta-12 desaturase)